MNIGPCRACKAPMLWVRTVTGAKMPLDPEHDHERGNVVLRASDNRAQVLGGPEEVEDWLFVHDGDGPYVSHFATCPERTRAVQDAARQETLL